ncbi:MAG: hypothetical protein NC909_01400, partial [Candidatus Omnitrophica bacterium]|nr:hypothetical protein [Candidatus Omnitrophota bacterium]
SVKTEKGIKYSRILDEKAMDRVAALVKRGYYVAFVTGREGPQLFEKGGLPFFEALEKRGIVDKVKVFAARGLYEVRKDGSIVLTPEAEKLRKDRRWIAKKIKDGIIEYNRQIERLNISEEKKSEQISIPFSGYRKI